MSERKTDNLPHVGPFWGSVDTDFRVEGYMRRGMPGAKRAIAQAIAGLMANDAAGENDTRQNISGSPRKSADTATKIRALKAAVSLVNESNSNQITKKQVRDMITTIVMEGSQAISSVNSCTKPEINMHISRREITQTMRQAQLGQLKKTATIPELDTKQ